MDIGQNSHFKSKHTGLIGFIFCSKKKKEKQSGVFLCINMNFYATLLEFLNNVNKILLSTIMNYIKVSDFNNAL